MTLYAYRLTIAVPEALMTAANHLAVAIGESAGDFESFTQADWIDANGNKYSVASTQATATLFAYAGSQLQRRDFAPEEWSFELASFAQSKIQLWMGEGDIPTANPEQIVGIVMDDAMMALQAMGLTRVETDDES
ncbi:hypothetical protein SH449x_000736 [Pirellulaceae bacterium SH449]